jgi:excisionase family DNA binding protein
MVTQKFETSELRQINLLTIQEVADWAKVSTKTVYRWIAANKIPANRLGNRTYRIPEKAIIDYLKDLAMTTWFPGFHNETWGITQRITRRI